MYYFSLPLNLMKFLSIVKHLALFVFLQSEVLMQQLKKKRLVYDFHTNIIALNIIDLIIIWRSQVRNQDLILTIIFARLWIRISIHDIITYFIINIIMFEFDIQILFTQTLQVILCYYVWEINLHSFLSEKNTKISITPINNEWVTVEASSNFSLYSCFVTGTST